MPTTTTLRLQMLRDKSLQLVRGGQAEQALELVEQVRQQEKPDEDDNQTYLARAAALMALGRWQEALAQFIHVAKQEDQDGYAGLAWIWSAAPDESLREPEKALQAARKAHKLAGDDIFNILESLASSYARLGKFEEAAKYQQRAVDQAPLAVSDAAARRLELYQQQQPFTQDD